MKLIILVSIAIAICIVIMMLIPSTKIKVVFAGDSITEQGTARNGYISLTKKSFPLKTGLNDHKFSGAGISGNKIIDLYGRLEEDVIAEKPAVTVVYIGINDVWQKIGGNGTPLDAFEKYYTAIIKSLKDANSKVALCTLSVIGEKKNKGNPLDEDLDEYSALIRKLSTAYNCTLVDLRAAFLRYEETHNLQDKEYGILTVDGVHLNEEGNKLVADEMMKALFNQ